MNPEGHSRKTRNSLSPLWNAPISTVHINIGHDPKISHVLNLIQSYAPSQVWIMSFSLLQRQQGRVKLIADFEAKPF